MGEWRAHQHPRDRNGRFITTGATVTLPGGGTGTVRGTREGSSGSEVLIELPDGRVGPVPAGAVKVAETPADTTPVADGSEVKVGDTVNHTDAPGSAKITAVNDDGSVETDRSSEPVDPGTLTPAENAPELDATPASEVPEGAQMFYDMAVNASRIADTEGTEGAHNRAAIMWDSAAGIVNGEGVDVDDPLFQDMLAKAARHERLAAAARLGNSPVQDLEDSGGDSVTDDIDGNTVSVGDYVTREDGRPAGRVTAVDATTGLITYTDSKGASRVLGGDEVRVSDDPDSFDVEDVVPSTVDIEKFASWGDRAMEIANSPGPSLSNLRLGLGSKHRAAIKQALHDAYNGENGLGSSGATVNFNAVSQMPGSLTFSGNILDADGNSIGVIERAFVYGDENDSNRVTEVHNAYFKLDSTHQGQGIANDLYRNQENWLIREGVPAITIEANIDVGGYAWARAGYDYQSASEARRHLTMMVKKAVQSREDPAITAVFQGMLDNIEENTPDGDGFPSPFDVSRVGYESRTVDQNGRPMWPGKKLMLGTNWAAIRHLTPPEESDAE